MARTQKQTRATPSAAATALTPSEEVFVAEYLVDLNATRAYQVAFPGSTYGSARVCGSRLLTRAHVRAEIEAARRAQQKRTGITADEVIRELALIAFSDVIDLCDDKGRLRVPRDVPPEARRALASMKVAQERVTRRVTRNGKTTTTETVCQCVIEYKFANKLDALGKLMRHLGLESIPTLKALLAALPADLSGAVGEALVEPLAETRRPSREGRAGVL
jgi:phage terminase small subunit